MSDINYSFSIKYELPEPKAQETDLFAFDDCLDFPISEGQSLVRSKRTGRQAILTTDALFALRQCTRFRTWNEQVKTINKIMPSGSDHRNDIQQVLQGARQAGLVVSASTFLEGIPRTTSPTTDVTACYCILTCDRPTALSRLLQSFSANHRFDSGNRYFVIDDSRGKENREQNRAIVERIGKENGAHYLYFGEEEQETALQRLRRELSPEHHESLAFLLGRHKNPSLPSYGRSRNWALLLGKGKHLVCLDDDILFERRIPKNAGKQIELGGYRREVDFFTTPEGWQSHPLSDQPDPTTGTALALIGQTLPQAIGYLGGDNLSPLGLKNTSSSELGQLSTDSQVLVSACGYLGDPGTASSGWLFELEGKSLERLLSSDANYRHQMTEPNTWTGSAAFRLTASFTLMSALTVLDGDTLMPPYFPLFRDEDFLFGGMVQKLHPKGLLADLPWAVPHLPVEKRQWNHNHKPETCGFLWFCNEMLLDHCNDLPLSPESRLVELSRIFQSLASLDDEGLSQKLGEKTMLLRSAKIYKLQQSLEETGARAPEQWRLDLSRSLEINQRGLRDNPVTGFSELPGNLRENLRTARLLFERFGAAVQSWPAILTSAAKTAA